MSLNIAQLEQSWLQAEALADKAHELAAQAQNVLAAATDHTSVWRAYVAVEYAILDVKMRHGLEKLLEEGQGQPLFNMQNQACSGLFCLAGDVRQQQSILLFLKRAVREVEPSAVSSDLFEPGVRAAVMIIDKKTA